MPLETGNWVEDLVPSNPPSGDGVAQGDDHLRLIKKVLKNTFPISDREFYFPRGEEFVADRTMTQADAGLLVKANTSGGDLVVTLPATAAVADGYYFVIRKSSAANSLTINAAGGDTINGTFGQLILTVDETWVLMWKLVDGAWSAVNGAGFVSTSLIVDGAVTNAKLADMVEARIKGRAAGAGTGQPNDLTGTSVTALLDVFGTAKGLVPPAAAADVGKVLFGAGTWSYGGAPHGQIVDEKAAATQGGTFTSGAWQTRDLQTTKRNISTFITLAANQFTLPTGSYFIGWAAPAFGVDGHKSRLYNVTDAAAAAVGEPSYSSNGNPSFSWSRGWVGVTLASAKAFRVEHQCTTTQASNGFGRAADFGAVETYTQVAIWRT